MIEIKVPSPGESISEVEIGSWLVESGSFVEKDQEVVSLESEKASLTVSAPESGTIQVLFQNGARVSVGSTIAKIDTAGIKKAAGKPVAISENQDKKVAEIPEKQKVESLIRITPVAREIMKSNNLSVEDIISGLRRITKEDVIKVIGSVPEKTPVTTERHQNRNRMSLLREKLSERLVAVKNETAMLTTFNEIDMSEVMSIRLRYKEIFEKKHQLKLGFMSFFTLAASRALMAFPGINSQLDGNEIVSFNYCDIGIAVQTPKGLLVPVLRNTQSMTLAQIEAGIAEMASRARDNKITIEELQGGTFSITNGGVFGSLLSTPIINPPQSAILGMHNIVERPVAVNGQVVIRPMMYVALSYDHRLIDGKDSVGFLKTIRDLIENPVSLLDPSGQAERSLLDL